MRFKVKGRIQSGTGALCFRHKHLSCLTHVSRFTFLSIQRSPCPWHWQGGLLFSRRRTRVLQKGLAPLKEPPVLLGMVFTRARAGGQWLRNPTPRRDGRIDVFTHIPQEPTKIFEVTCFFLKWKKKTSPHSVSLVTVAYYLTFTNSNLYHIAAHTRVSYLSLTLCSPWSHCFVFLSFLALANDKPKVLGNPNLKRSL